MWPYTVPISHHIPAFLGFLSRSETIFYRLRLGDTPGYPWLLHKSTKTVQCHPFYSFGYESVWKWRCIWILTGRRDSIGMEGTFFPDQTILEKRLIFEAPSEKMTLLRAIPTLTLICHSFWHIIWVWHSILAFYLTFYSGSLSGIYSDILSGILCGIYTDIFSGILSGILCHMFWHTWWRAIWHSIWHSILAFYLASILTFFLAFNLVYLQRYFVVEVRWGTLWSRARGVGPVGKTLIRSLQLMSGRNHFDPEVAVQVQLGTLQSRACSWGPAEEGGGGRQAS